mgnify:CR=1 FL=1
MAITAAMVKELRDQTGAGMMDAKKALTETDGDMEAAVDLLRVKGLAKADKKSGRTAAEGLVAVATDGGTGVVVEVNSETDFVARNAEFQAMVGEIAKIALGVDDIEALKAAPMGGKTVADIITDKVATIGENMSLRRMHKLTGANVASYVHNAVAPGMGKIGVLAALEGESGEIGKQVAMHVAATNPASLDVADLDPVLVEREKQVLQVASVIGKDFAEEMLAEVVDLAGDAVREGGPVCVCGAELFLERRNVGVEGGCLTGEAGVHGLDVSAEGGKLALELLAVLLNPHIAGTRVVSAP